ncbi:MAG: cell wall-binding repeat-containing protein [Acidimicrobiaceae bacterium]|nr:cell wall-binding repeat-containing protein [Acidimicrobiaceae bacterium]
MSARVPPVTDGPRPDHADDVPGRPVRWPQRQRQRQRQGRPLTRALLAVVMAAGVVVLAGAPAQGAAAVISVDRLSGADRYATAADIAEAYADEIESRGRPAIDTILITSGADEHFGCALPAPALSRRYEAPLLLTERSELPNSVERFVEDFDIDRAFILGGTDVVSNDVKTELEDLNNVDVTRVAGDDCYGTAVEVAELVGSSPGVPGTYRREGRTALVATGEVFADALAAGPLAYTGEHPILLTPRASLDQRVSQFLRSSRTEHVIMLGGTAAVSSSVERAIEQLGISVERLFGTDRHATAVSVGEVLLGENSPDSCFGGDQVGLAYGRKAADAITSGPLLGELCAPLVLTELRDLPRATSDFLEADEYVTGDADGDLRITIFGGTAAVSRSAENDAVNAARLREIRATVVAVEGACHFTVTFSEPVRTIDARRPTNYTLEGNALTAGAARVDVGTGSATSEAVVILGGAASPSTAAVPTGCLVPLEARDRVGVEGQSIRGATDRRTVRATDSAVRSDNTRPNLTVTAPDGGLEVAVEISEPVRQASFDVTFTRDRVDDTISVFVLEGETQFTIFVPYEELQQGDRIVIPSGAVEDFAGNSSLRELVTVRRDTVLPRARRVTVTDPVARASSYVELSGFYNRARVSRALRIEALDDGAAFGAAGNDWEISIEFDENLGAGDPARVTVTPALQRIDVATSGETDVPSLVDDLNGDPIFNDLFEADLTDHEFADDALISETLRYVAFVGGLSTVDLRLEWSEPVRDCDALDRPVRLDRIEIDTNANGVADFALDGFGAAASEVEFVAAPDGNEYIVAGRAACDETPGVASGTLVARISSENVAELPSLGSRAFIRAGAAYDLRGNPAPNQTLNALRRS